jgi:hypothetical protein
MCVASGDNGFTAGIAPKVKQEWTKLVGKQPWDQLAKELERFLKKNPAP